MKKLLFSVGLVVLVCPSCRTQKEVQTDIAISRDSVAVAKEHRTAAVIDSVLTHMILAFDTLSVTVERPATAETVRLKAVGARLATSSTSHRTAVETAVRLDSTEVNTIYTDKSAEHITAIQACNPPNLTLIITIACMLGALLFFLRKKE